MDQNERNRLVALRAALVGTTNTPGWKYVEQIANNAVQKAVQEALDEENPVTGESKRLKAAALQKGFKALFDTIRATKGFDPNAADDSGFGELEGEA